MPYAANQAIATDKATFEVAGIPFVEITDAQYQEAIEGMTGGMEVTIDEGFKVAFPPPPPPPETLPPTDEELAATAKAVRDQALAVAAIRIAPLQDAVDLDEATAEDVAMLKKWKQYRIAVNRIDQQEGFPSEITWPSEPSSV